MIRTIKSGRQAFTVVSSPLRGSPYTKHEVFHGGVKIGGDISPVDGDVCYWMLKKHRSKEEPEIRIKKRGGGYVG